MAAGNYAATTLSAVDTDLATGNIRSGVNIFGVVGTLQSVTDRYLDLGNGTVRDQETGLMWTKNANHGSMDWAAAVAYCNNMNAGSGTYGYTDWRLPSVKQDGPGDPMGKPELDTLGRPGGIPGATPYSMPGAPFTGVQSDLYLSSTTDAFFGLACLVNLDNGGVYAGNKADPYYVWPVRGGQ